MAPMQTGANIYIAAKIMDGFMPVFYTRPFYPA